jgi:hypothetical protein
MMITMMSSLLLGCGKLAEESGLGFLCGQFRDIELCCDAGGKKDFFYARLKPGTQSPFKCGLA